MDAVKSKVNRGVADTLVYLFTRTFIVWVRARSLKLVVQSPAKINNGSIART